MPGAHDGLFEVDRVEPDGTAVGISAPEPIANPNPLPLHPGLARTSNSMHEDSYASDVSPRVGPHSADPEIRYFRYRGSFGGMCPSFAFDEGGNLYTISFSKDHALLLKLDAETLAVRASFPLPARQVNVWRIIKTSPFRPFKALDRIFRDTSGGAYFFVDRKGRVVVPALDDTIKVLSPSRTALHGFTEGVPLAPLDDPIHDGDNLVAALPDFREREGRPVYWFTSQRGVVGLVDGETGLVLDRYLLGRAGLTLGSPERPERIQNSFAVGTNGAFVVSNYALYRFEREDRHVALRWRARYCRLDRCGGDCAHNDPEPGCGKPVRKPGQIDFGSGTTPTLLGDDLVVITDGQRRMNVCVYRQSDGALVTRRPAFSRAGSACENSVVGFERSVVVGNTHGYRSPFLPATNVAAGMERVDLVDGGLKRVWCNEELRVMSAPPTLSLGNGLVYVYTAEKHRLLKRRWSLVGVCYRSGAVRYRVPVTTERKRKRMSRFDNAWGTMTLGPDRSLFLCMWRGFLRIRDR